MRLLRQRRYETIPNLAEEFGVSTRTILRDIEVLSVTEPIYTQCGRYGGGVYVTGDFFKNRRHTTDNELSVLHKLSKFAEERAVCELSIDEKILLKDIISHYTK